MITQSQIKEEVKQKYSAIALHSKETNETSCCGSGCCSDELTNIMNDDYKELKGYNANADLGLGCGLPTEFAKIKPGDTVVDLGSGAGNDCFVARSEVGAAGKIIGVDFSDAMISKARLNAEKSGFHNVEFRRGDIENIPLNDNVADVVISNCVLNLVPDKHAVFSEIFRVLKPGAHFSISDIVLVGELPDAMQKDAEMYAGCVSGAIQKQSYLNIIHENGFKNVTIQKEKQIHLPDDILKNYLNEQELSEFKNGNTGIFSITVYAAKEKGGRFG